MSNTKPASAPEAILYLPGTGLEKYRDLVERVHRRYGNVRVEPVFEEKEPSIYLTRQKRLYAGLQAVLDLSSECGVPEREEAAPGSRA